MREPDKKPFYEEYTPLFNHAQQAKFHDVCCYHRYVATGEILAAKHSIIKRYINDHAPDAYNLAGYYHFVGENLADQFLSRILHQHQPAFMPKGKFQYWYAYSSRLYPFDDATMPLSKLDQAVAAGRALPMNGHDLFGVLDRHQHGNKLPSTHGLVATIAFNMITGNGDPKLENIAAYKRPGEHVYDIAPIDLGCSLKNPVKNRHLMTQWTKEKVFSVLQGTHTKSGMLSVAEALAETVGGIGMRTNRHYQNHPCDPTWHGHLTRMIADELDRVTLPEGMARNHTNALLQVFHQQCNIIQNQRQEAYQKTMQNVVRRVLPGLVASKILHASEIQRFGIFIQNEMSRHWNQLSHSVRNFRSYLHEAEHPSPNNFSTQPHNKRRRIDAPSHTGSFR